MPKIRNIIIFSIIAVALILIYIFFVKPYFSEKDNLLSSSANTTLPNIDGSTSVNNTTANAKALTTKDFLTLFSGVKNIKLDDAILLDAAFGSLLGSSVILTPDGTEGRANPFAPLGSDSIPAVPAPASSATSSTSSSSSTTTTPASTH